jgi:hypothetical protein
MHPQMTIFTGTRWKINDASSSEEMIVEGLLNKRDIRRSQ